MRQILIGLAVTAAIAWAGGGPFAGRWDFNVSTPNGMRACWLGVKDHNGKTEVWFQPTGGHVRLMEDAVINGSHLKFTVSPGDVWELEAKDGKLTGTETRKDHTIEVAGVRAPEIHRTAPKAWSQPESLFNGKDLTGWEPIGDVKNSHWVVKDGLLVNEAHGANLMSTRKFEDFKLHFEANCPDKANSGFYLRGRYELQLEYEPVGTEPPEREMGSIYGRLGPKIELPRTPGQWETFDVTLVGRTVTVARNGKITINKREIEGITGGALDANEGEPGPFYIQGDHTGGLKFRNITVAVPRT